MHGFYPVFTSAALPDPDTHSTPLERPEIRRPPAEAARSGVVARRCERRERTAERRAGSPEPVVVRANAHEPRRCGDVVVHEEAAGERGGEIPVRVGEPGVRADGV